MEKIEPEFAVLSLYWESSDEKIAEVDQKGIVEIKDDGRVTITDSYNDNIVKCFVLGASDKKTDKSDTTVKNSLYTQNSNGTANMNNTNNTLANNGSIQNPYNNSTSAGDVDSLKTGDDSNIALVIGIALAAAALAAVTGISISKRKNKTK